MSKKFYLIFAVIFSTIFQNRSQQLEIGVLDNSTFTYLQQNAVKTALYTLAFKPIPPDINSNFNSYINFKKSLSSSYAVIGAFNYGAATICQSSSLPYLIIDEQIDRSANTGALIDFSLNLRLLAGALNYTLNKYNWLQNLQFMSDSSSNAMEILWGLTGKTIKQCNFLMTDNDTNIAGCFQNLNLVSTPGRAYIFVTSDENSSLLDKIMMQSLFRSLQYNSFIFLPMLNSNSFLINYQYSGGVLYTFKQTDNDMETSVTILQSNALAALNHINNTIISNKFNNSINKALVLPAIQIQDFIYKNTGDKLVNLFFWKIQSYAIGSLLPVSIVQYALTFNFQKDIPDQTNLAVSDSVSAIYIPDQIYVTNIINSDGSVSPSGFILESLNSILIPIKLSYSLSLTGVTTIGRLTKFGYTGLLGQLNMNASDMIGIPVLFEPSYLNRFIYSQKIFVVPYSILMKQSTKGLNLPRLAEPFSPIVWLVIIVTIIFLSIILWLINLISPNIADPTQKLTVSNSIFMVIGSFLMAKMLVKPNMISTQIFYLLIWLITLLLISAYVANLSVSIAFQKAQIIKFITIDQLWSEKNIKWTFIQDSYLYNRVMLDMDNNLNTTLVSMYRYAVFNWLNLSVLNESTNIPEFLFNNPDFGILNDAYHNMYYSLRNCSLITMNDASNNISLAYIAQPGFKYQTQLYQQIITLQQTGTIDNLQNKYFYVGQCSSTNPIISNIQPLDIYDMGGIFVLIAVGIIAAFPAAVIEYLLNKSKLQCQRKTTGNSLRFGQVYRAKVTGLDRNGVTVDIGRLNLFSTTNEGRIYYVPKKYLGIKKKGEREILAPTDQGIMIGTKLLLKYMGNNPVDSKRIFVQVHKK